jgi:hypothetical protein
MNSEGHEQQSFQAQDAVPPPPRGENVQSAGRAAFCAVIPGIGAVYNRDYVKGVVHFSIFAGLIVIAKEVGFVFGLAAFAFYIFTIIDAYRSAEHLSRMRLQAPEAQNGPAEINFPLWGGILVLMGVLFLLDNLGAIRLQSIVAFWPLIFIGIGLYLILQSTMGAQANPRRREPFDATASSGRPRRTGSTSGPEEPQ